MTRKKATIKDKVQEEVPENAAVSHFSNVLKTGEASKLGAKSTGKVLYEIAQNDEDNQLYVRIAGQTEGAGLHSKEWIPLDALFELIESQEEKSWKSQLYKPLFKGGSANNHGFCAAIVRDLGLAQRAESSLYLHVLGEKYSEKKVELQKLAE